MEEINRKLRGWSAYFWVSKAYRIVDRHTSDRLRPWLCRKHRVRGQGRSRSPDASLYDELGLLRLQGLIGSLPWATA